MRHLALLALTLAACSAPTAKGSSSSSGGTSGATSTGSTSGSSSSTTGGSSGSSSSSGSSGSTGSSTSGSTGASACGAPQGQTGATLSATDAFAPPALAWSGSEGALLTAQKDSSGWTLNLTRLDATGAALSARQMGTNPDAALPPSLTVAASGSTYLSCWRSAAANSTCILTSAGADNVLGAATAPYTAPSAAFGPAGYLLAGVDSRSHVIAQHIDSSGYLQGQPIDLGPGSLPRIVARDGGYAVVHLDGSGALVAAYLDAQAAPASTVDTFAAQPGLLANTYPFAVASLGARVVAVWQDQTRSPVPVLAAVRGDGSQGEPAVIDPPGSSHGNVAVAAMADGFGATWSDADNSIHYVALSVAGAAAGSPKPVASANWNDAAHALAALPDGFLLATALNADASQLNVVRLTCH